MKFQKRNFPITIILGILIIFSILAINASAFSIKQNTITDVVAVELSIPATYEVTLYNDGASENFSIYNLVQLKLSPEDIFVDSNSQKTFILSVLPARRFEEKTSYYYFIKRIRVNAVEGTVIMTVKPISKILIPILPAELNRNDQSVTFALNNKENINLGTFNYTLTSDLFTYSSTETLNANESKTITIPIDLKTKYGGQYTIKFSAWMNNEYNYEANIPIELKTISNVVETKQKKFNFFGYRNILTKTNEGNIKETVTLTITLSNFEDAFTHFNVPPTSKINHVASWQRELQPGESFSAEASTEYTIPIIIIIILAIILISYIVFLKKKVIVKKKVIKLKTKGGEFAAKIVIAVKNVGNDINNIILSDRLPGNTKLYEKFGSVKPDKIEKYKLEWNFSALAPREEIVVSYIVYSKVGMIGPLQLPEAVFAFTDHAGKRHSVTSGKTYVM